MNLKSIHFKIVLWISSAICVATFIIFSVFYLVTSRILFSEVDKELEIHSQNLTEFNIIPGMVVTVLDQNGGIKRSTISSDTPYLSYKYLFEQAQKTNDSVFLNQNIGNTPMRFIVRPIRIDGILDEVVLIAHPIEAIQKSLNLIQITLGGVFLLFILPSILGGRLLAIKIMYPISKIADEMESISSTHLDKRLDNPKSKDEIEKLTLTFNRLLDRLQDSFERERQFIGDVAHELKTPVATLRSGVELTLSKERNLKEYQGALNETLVDTNRLSTVIKNILDLAWLGAERNIKNTSAFSLSEGFIELTEIADKLAAQKNIKVTSKITPNIYIKGSEDKITRAILNIIDNAIKYTPQGKTVFISLSKTDKEAIIKVEDTGIGILKKDLIHVFDRFYRGSKTAKIFGSGLGLAISQGIVKAHNGEIKITSTVAKGTSVRISLPQHLK